MVVGTEDDLQTKKRYDEIRVVCLYNQTVYGGEKLNHEQKSRKNNEMRILISLDKSKKFLPKNF